MENLQLSDDRITLRQIKEDPKIRALIEGANEVMRAMGYTEHGHRHAGVVSNITRLILEAHGLPARTIELGQIAAYMHDIGNVIARHGHPAHGAAMAFTLLNELGMPAHEIAPILGAIGNHEESAGIAVSPMSAALIIADKSDVHRSRVQNPILESYDIHDRVNAAVTRSRVEQDSHRRVISLVLEIDTSVATVMEYFEIFLSRMMLCRTSCDLLGSKFSLSVNGVVLE